MVASGEVITATASSYPDLWRALKGGSNNFGVVTRFIVRCFPSTDIWSGFIHAPNSQSLKALTALHESVKRADPKSSGISIDPHAAGPITCFTYVQALGIRIVTVHLAYTRVPEEPRQWSAYWRGSKFASLWRLWSTFKVQTLTSSMEEMNGSSPPGKRWSFSTTTIKNDLSTITAAHTIYNEAISSLRNVTGLIYGIVMQPLLPSWTRKGDPSPLGIHEATDDALIIISLSVSWQKAVDDKQIYATMQEVIERIDAVATANGTSHPYRYLNYCAKWQQPLEGYGEDNLQFLKEVSRRYDPDGLFQRGCEGGFKLSR